MDDQPKNPDAIWLRIADYLAGDATPDERTAMEQWVSESPENKEIFDQISQAWDKTPQRPKPAQNSDFDIATFEASVAQDIGVISLRPNDSANLAHRQKAKRADFSRYPLPTDSLKKGYFLSRGLRGWAKYSATLIALGACLAMFGAQYLPRITGRSTPASESHAYVTKSGQRAKITLVSGAQVTLAPATKLIVSGTEVLLDGQAVFTVLHNDKSPFVVHTGNATVRVLGTTFSVRSYRGEAHTNVTVAEGKVAANRAVLAVGDAIDISSRGTVVSHNTDITTAFAWTEGRLVFNETPLADVATQLEQWYGVTISLPDSALRSWLITGTFAEKTLRVKELDFIAEFVGLRYKRLGNHITFFRR